MRGRTVVWAIGAVVWTAACGRGRPAESARPLTPVTDAPAKSVQAGAGLISPRLVREVIPLLPPDARKRGIKGPVEMEIEIDYDARVSVKCVLRGDPLLNRAAEEAVTQWKYEWASADGAREPADETVFVKFRER